MVFNNHAIADSLDIQNLSDIQCIQMFNQCFNAYNGQPQYQCHGSVWPEHILVQPLQNQKSAVQDMNNSHYHYHNYDLFQRYYEERPFVFLLTVLKQVFLGFRESPLHFFTVPLFSPLENNRHHHHPNHPNHDLEHQVG